jgi:hypothetical protein
LGREISGGEYSRGNVTLGEGDLTELLYEILFNCPTFSLPNFSFGDVSGELPRAFFPSVLISWK